MAPTLKVPHDIDVVPLAVRRRNREARLRQARAFRREQIASLERELAEDTRGDTVTSALLVAATTALTGIDAALDRISEGTYGRCVTCRLPIPENRLDVLPMAAQCASCQFTDDHTSRET